MSCPAYLPWEILSSIVLAESLVITQLVPFDTFGGSKEHKIIIGAATFNKCKGNPDISKEFKNSVGNWTAWESSGTESKDLYSTQSPGNCSTRVVLIAWVVLLRGAKMQHSDNQTKFVKFWSKSGYTMAINSLTLLTKVPMFSGS